MTAISFVFTELANIMKYRGGFLYNLVFTEWRHCVSQTTSKTTTRHWPTVDSGLGERRTGWAIIDRAYRFICCVCGISHDPSDLSSGRVRQNEANSQQKLSDTWWITTCSSQCNMSLKVLIKQFDIRIIQFGRCLFVPKYNFLSSAINHLSNFFAKARDNAKPR